jgi:hypothetical protein
MSEYSLSDSMQENSEGSESYIEEGFAGTDNALSVIRTRLNAVPKKDQGIKQIPELFANYGNILKLEDMKIVPTANIFDVTLTTQNKQYTYFSIKNILAKSIKINDIKVQSSIFHCNFDNVDLSGKYTAELKLTKNPEYNKDYKQIIYDAIPEDTRFQLENMNVKNAATVDVKELLKEKSGIDVVIFSDCTFDQLNIINAGKMQFIFINCTGVVNITFNMLPEIMNTLKSITCPKQDSPKQKCPPAKNNTKYIVIAVVATVAIGSGILYLKNKNN